MKVSFFGLVACLVATAVASAEDSVNAPIKGLGPTGAIAKVQGGFQFLEGPAADGNGNLVFSDIPANKLYKLGADGRITVLSDDSGHANGTMFTSSGELMVCQMDGRVAVMNAAGKVARVVSEKYEGKRYNAPNDLVIDSTCGVYFTDPHFRAPQPLPQGKTAVYYVDAAGNAKRLIDDLEAPNGVILSPDEKTLYVIPSGQAEMMAYDVLAPGKLGHGRVFCTLRQKDGQTGRGGDGLTVDVQGNLYITSALGLQVFDPSGAPLGVIAVPETPANCTFGGPDNKTLYVTARTSLYSMRMDVAGHIFAKAK